VSDKILMCGNEALAEAAIQAGLDAYFGYPITPQNEVPAYMARRMPQESKVFVQCESELAAINMVFGAAATGARAMTSSSSPGISLMQEGLSYLAGAELPAVVANIMRGGPGLGNIAPSQSDYFQSTRGGGHGDYHMIVLAPYSVQEIADLVHLAFDLADKYRITVMILGDGFLGQMMEPVEINRRKSNQKPPAKPWALTGAANRDQNIVRSLFLAEGVLEELNLRLQKKYREISDTELLYKEEMIDDADIIVVAYGIMARIAHDAVHQARDNGIKAGLFRPITLWPFPYNPLSNLAHDHSAFLTVEMSYGQMLDDVRLAVNGKSPVHFFGRAGGAVPSVQEVLDKIMETSKQPASG